MPVRKLIRKLLPKPIVSAIRPYRAKILAKKYFKNLTTRQIFTTNLTRKILGESPATMRINSFLGMGRITRRLLVDM